MTGAEDSVHHFFFAPWSCFGLGVIRIIQMEYEVSMLARRLSVKEVTMRPQHRTEAHSLAPD